MIRENLIHKLNEELGDIWGGSKEILADEILAAIREEIGKRMPMPAESKDLNHKNIARAEGFNRCLHAVDNVLDEIFGERKGEV